ncbi:MAG: NADH:ubiquinone oxidoreductase subunit 4 (chain M), partial [Microbacteriaceae bacterium]|nr:NADH:ubiquinone oxidoreductase subunit 4 (chain M) [Microbacteriaceae bacterium]
TSYLLTTLIHEYAHILTLDLEQEPAGGGECEPEFRSQGCWYDDAYLAAFWDEFWRGYGDEATEIGSEDDEARDAFYDAHEEDFVSSYAATSVEEDIAESFMAYVIEAVPDPSQSTVAAKLAFFERYPELAAIRERIRAEFGDELQPVWDE